jgi:hypothetical protein
MPLPLTTMLVLLSRCIPETISLPPARSPHSAVSTPLEAPSWRVLSSVLPIPSNASRSSRLQVLARSSPDDKKVLIKTLRKLGEIVGVTGSGMNDGPAPGLPAVFPPIVGRRRYNTHLTKQYRPLGSLACQAYMGLPALFICHPFQEARSIMIRRGSTIHL